MATTCGLEELRDYRPARDAVAVSKIRRGGAVIFGKTNLPAAAADHQSCNTVFGLTRNPWYPERTVGGSSGGAAAALAAGLTSLELGSDIGGSIRVPAHFCGVYGHKPSYGLVRSRGISRRRPIILLRPNSALPGHLRAVRPISNCSLTSCLVQVDLDAAGAGCDCRRLATRTCAASASRYGMTARLIHLNSAYAAAIDALVEDLRRRGVQVDDKARPVLDPVESHDIYLQTLFGIIGADLPPLAVEAILEAGRNAPAGSYPRRVAGAIRQGLAQHLAVVEQREKLMRAWRSFFLDYDVLLCPITPTVAFPHDVDRLDLAAQFERTLMVDGRTVPYMDNLAWPGLVTVANLPATAMPTRHLVDGLPAGVQVIGPYLGDRTTLRFAQLVEQELGGFIKPTIGSSV